MQLSRAARVILVGRPASGKGTQAERMLKRFPQLSSVASGDLLRAHVRNKTAIGLEAQKLMSAGSLVPDAMILQLIVAELTEHGWLNSQSANGQDKGARPSLQEKYMVDESPRASFILDGFPRTASQAQQLGELLPMNFVVHIDTPVEVILDRVANRWVHEPSGRVYNTTFNPPKTEGKDDITGEPLIQREDDSPETWRKRLRKFEETSIPLLEHYDKLGILWEVKGKTSDEISPKLFQEFERRFGVA